MRPASLVRRCESLTLLCCVRVERGWGGVKGTGKEGHVAPNEASACQKESHQAASIRHAQFQNSTPCKRVKKQYVCNVLRSIITVCTKAEELVSLFCLNIHPSVSWRTCSEPLLHKFPRDICKTHPHTSVCEKMARKRVVIKLPLPSKPTREFPI